MVDLLTLFVCLKDRTDFTKRLCAYLSFTKYPYPVYFADGSLGSENQDFFNCFKDCNFRYTYRKYPPDLTLQDYYRKCSQSVNEIETPYIMLADNDDFPIARGQEQAVSFLEHNANFVGCNGRVLGVSVYPDSGKPYGTHFLLHKYYCTTMDVSVDLNQNFALDRIKAYLQNFYSIFYSVFRRDALSKTLNYIETLNFSELGVHELFFSYAQLVQGKLHTINDVTYVRQRGVSQAAAYQKDWFHRVFYTDWLSDCKNAIHIISALIACNESSNPIECYNQLYEGLVERIRIRYIPNDFYLVKNPHLFVKRYNFVTIFFNKIFRVYPWIAERLSLKVFLKDGIYSSSLEKIIKIE